MSCPDNDGLLETPVPEIDFGLDKSLVSEGQNRLLWQFRESDNLCQLLQVYLDQVQDLWEATINALDVRQIAKASGVQLDVIGELVGQQRLVTAFDIAYFGWSDVPLAIGWAELVDGEPVGGGRWLELGEDPTGVRELEDPEYRLFIIAKIFKNHLEFCSPCELADIANTVLGSVTKTHVPTVGPAQLAYYFEAPNGLTSNDQALILSVIDDKKMDRQRIILSAAGVGIEYFAYSDKEKVFGFSDSTNPKVTGWQEIIVNDVYFGFDDSDSPVLGFSEIETPASGGIYSNRPNLAGDVDFELDDTTGGYWAEIIA
jgi:hypothetical protein